MKKKRQTGKQFFFLRETEIARFLSALLVAQIRRKAKMN